MKFDWTDIDGKMLEIDNTEPIETRLRGLKDRYDAAQASGEHKLAAILHVHYDEQLAQWRKCAAEVFADLELSLDKVIKNLRDRAEWWQEWFATHERPDQPTQCQLKLLGEQPAELSPRSWEQAATALNLVPDYRPPAPGRNWDAVEAVRMVEDLARRLQKSAQMIGRNCQQGDVSQEDFTRHSELERKFVGMSEALEEAILE